jgi:hypothetical protein
LILRVQQIVEPAPCSSTKGVMPQELTARFGETLLDHA